MKFWRPLMFSIFWVNLIVSAVAAPTASDNVKQRLADAMREQFKHLLTSPPSSMPGQAPSAEQIERQVDAVMTDAMARYEKIFTLPEPMAEQLLTTGPDDAGNRTAIKKNWEVYKKLSRPLPVFLKYLHGQVETGAITSGWDLELVRRISDAHSSEIERAVRQEAEQPQNHS